MVYNFALPPLTLHTLQTGDARRLTRWAADLKAISRYATYFNFLDSHDGVGILGANGILTRAEIDALVRRTTERGGYISYRRETDGSETPYEMNITSYSALNPEGNRETTDLKIGRYLAARSIPLVLRGVPGIYLHGLLGSRNDVEAVQSGGEKRDINRKNLRKSQLLRMLSNPRCTTARIVDGMRRMLQVRRRERAFHPNADQIIIDCGPSIFVALRVPDAQEDAVLTVVNVTDSAHDIRIPTADAPGHCSRWRNLFSGSRTTAEGGRLRMRMSPYEVAWLKPSPPRVAATAPPATREATNG